VRNKEGGGEREARGGMLGIEPRADRGS